MKSRFAANRRPRSCWPTGAPRNGRPMPSYELPMPRNGASAAAERVAVAAEQVAEAALVTLEAAKKSLDVVRSGVVEARAAAVLSVAEQAGTADLMRDAQGASEASRERYQARIAELRTGNGQTGEDGAPEITD